MLRQWLLSVFGPSSRFLRGDTVQPVKGERELMVVTKVVLNRNSTEPQLLCQWTDSQTNEFREHLFAESEVEPFDWSRSMEAKPTASSDWIDTGGSASAKRVNYWEALAGIDVAVGLSRLNNNKEVYKKLLLKFRDSHQHFAGELSSKMRRGEWTEARQMVHTLKGLAGTLGMKRLEEVVRDLEERLSRNEGDCSRPLKLLSDELANILQSIGSNVQPEEVVVSIQPHASTVTALMELERSLLEHNPRAIDQWSQIGLITGHERDSEILGKAINTYDFEKALGFLQSIRSNVDDTVK